MRPIKFGLAFCLLVFGAAADPALADDAAPITKIESRSLPPSAVTQRIFSQLAAQMRFEPYPPGRAKPRLPLSDMQFWTVPRATYVPGLCQSNLVTVYFGPTGPKKDANTKVTATGLETSNRFHFLKDPVSPQGDVDDAARTRTDKACARLKPGTFFNAKDADAAASGALAIQKAIQTAQRGMPTFSCVFGSESAEACRQRVAKLSLANMTDVRPCPNGCQTVWVADPDLDLSLTIHTSSGSGDLVQVELNELVTTADRRLD